MQLSVKLVAQGVAMPEVYTVEAETGEVQGRGIICVFPNIEEFGSLNPCFTNGWGCAVRYCTVRTAGQAVQLVLISCNT